LLASEILVSLFDGLGCQQPVPLSTSVGSSAVAAAAIRNCLIGVHDDREHRHAGSECEGESQNYDNLVHGDFRRFSISPATREHRMCMSAVASVRPGWGVAGMGRGFATVAINADDAYLALYYLKTYGSLSHTEQVLSLLECVRAQWLRLEPSV
jgi:hypothetical protein